MRQQLWPEAPAEYLTLDLDAKLANLNYAVFVASGADGQLVAFLEAGIRDTAEGCDTSRPRRTSIFSCARREKPLVTLSPVHASVKCASARVR